MPSGNGPACPRLCRLMEQQIRDWPLLRQGAESLKAVQRRALSVSGDKLVVQFNPLRTKSTAADVSAQAIAARPCFLCGKNRPPEQAAVELSRGYLALCNPMPIFDMHFTVSHPGHEPQNRPGVFEDMLALAEELGPEMCIFYNGAKAGASAPDHLHFQSAPANALPVRGKMTSSKPVSVLNFAGNEYLMLAGTKRDELHRTIAGLVDAHAQSTAGGRDLLNVAAFYRPGAGFELAVAFRQKHRPAIFFADEPERRLISPAAVEMFGVVVTVRESDYERLNEELMRSVFAEVVKPAGTVSAA